MSKNILFIIPARANSKRFPGKNLFKINGKSLLQHKIENCRKASAGDILVTSDDENILLEAKKLKVDFVRKRPKILVGDGPTTPIVHDAVKYYEKKANKKISMVVLTQVTSPFILYTDFNAAINFLDKNLNYKSLISCSLVEKNFSWCLFEDKKNKSYLMPNEILNMIDRFSKNKKVFMPNGGIYIIRRKTLKKNGLLYSNPIKIWEMNKLQSLDIDYKEEALFAETIAKDFL